MESRRSLRMASTALDMTPLPADLGDLPFPVHRAGRAFSTRRFSQLHATCRQRAGMPQAHRPDPRSGTGFAICVGEHVLLRGAAEHFVSGEWWFKRLPRVLRAVSHALQA